jgi:peptidoglycan hydrolase-like protein with peptidoglycan-binding domain
MPATKTRSAVLGATALLAGGALLLGPVSPAFAQGETTTLPPTTVTSTAVPSTSALPSTSSASSTPATTSVSSVVPTTIGGSTTAAPTTTSAAQGSATPFVPVPVLRQGSKGADVEAMERKLDLLRYDVGKVDGRFDGQTWQGLMAFQKLNGLKRTGKFDIATQQELATAGIPGGLIPNGGLPRVEVDISRQVLLYFDEYGLNRVVAVSSGSEKKYCELSKKSGKQACGDARTPRGNYKIERRIKGKRESDLGTLYSPMYFTGGFAIHGSPSIPAYPASHGCVRITNRTADWMFEEVKNGTPVFVFD